MPSIGKNSKCTVKRWLFCRCVVAVLLLLQIGSLKNCGQTKDFFPSALKNIASTSLNSVPPHLIQPRWPPRKRGKTRWLCSFITYSDLIIQVLKIPTCKNGRSKNRMAFLCVRDWASEEDKKWCVKHSQKSSNENVNKHGVFQVNILSLGWLEICLD